MIFTRLKLSGYCFLILNSSVLGQTHSMSNLQLETALGQIHMYTHITDAPNTPVIFLHGLFFDHHLWDYQVSKIIDRDVYVLDMPLHGKSIQVNKKWDLEDGAKMLLEIIEKLHLKEVHAVGHSWGGMTILRAGELEPGLFKSMTFFNTPFKSYGKNEIKTIQLQHLGLLFKKLFIQKASEKIFAISSLKRNPRLIEYFSSCLEKLSNKNIRYLNHVVRINATDKQNAIRDLKIKHQIIVGKEDQLAPAPPSDSIIYVESGHSTPLELPEISTKLILSILN